MATTAQRLAALEAWKTAHLQNHVLSGHTHSAPAHDHALTYAAKDHTHAVTPPPEPVPPPPPPPPPPPSTETPPDAAPGTLQALINAAAAGSTLTAPRMTYHESITVNKALTVRGQGSVLTGDNVRTSWLNASGVPDVVFEEFTFRDCAEVPNIGTDPNQQKGGITANNSDRFGLTRVHIIKGPAAGIACSGGTGQRFIDVEVERCPSSGFIGGGQSNIKFLGTNNPAWPNRYHHSRTSPSVNPLNEGGGIKIGNGATDIEFGYIEVDHNAGPGIWLDINATNVRAHHYNLHHNTHAAGFFEISAGGVFGSEGGLADNISWENGWDIVIDGRVYQHDTRQGPDFGWAASILASSSRDYELKNTLFAWNRDAIGMIYQADRPPVGNPMGGGCMVPARNHYAHDCVVVAEAGRYGVTWAQDGSGGTLFSDPSNRGERINFWYPGNNGRFGYLGDKTLAQLNASLGNEAGQYITDAARNTLLAAATGQVYLPAGGIPLAPEAHGV